MVHKITQSLLQTSRRVCQGRSIAANPRKGRRRACTGCTRNECEENKRNFQAHMAKKKKLNAQCGDKEEGEWELVKKPTHRGRACAVAPAATRPSCRRARERNGDTTWTRVRRQSAVWGVLWRVPSSLLGDEDSGWLSARQPVSLLHSHSRIP